MRCTIDNRLRLQLRDLTDLQLEDLQRGFTYANPQYAKMAAMRRGKVPRGVPRFIHSWVLGGGELSLPRGGLAKVRSVLGLHGPVDVEDRTTLGDPALAGQLPRHILRLRPYQQHLQRAAIEREVALIRSPPGSGKTTVGYAIAAELQLPTLVVVPTDKIFRQWVRGVEKNLGMDPGGVGVIQGKRRTVRPLTIGMQQTLRSCARDYAGVFGLVIGDEAQRFAAETFFEVIDRLCARYRVGMTADERRADGKEFLIYDVFGEVACEVSRQTLLAEGAVLDAAIRVVPTEFRAAWYVALPPLRRLNAKVMERLTVELTGDRQRNELAMQVLGWCVAEQQPTITLATRREHCATLNSLSIARGWNSGLLLGGKESEVEFSRTEAELADGELRQAVGTYQAVGVGFDLPLVSRGIFAAPCASRDARQQFAQYCGRFERVSPESGKRDSAIYYLWDQHVHGMAALRNIAKWKPNVTVLRGDAWVPARQYIREETDRAHQDEELDPFNL